MQFVNKFQYTTTLPNYNITPFKSAYLFNMNPADVCLFKVNN